MVDDHDAAAELLDIVEIVSSEQHRGAEFTIDGAQKLADVILGYHVEADGRLIQKKQRGIMKQRGGEIAAHALA